MPKPEFEHYGLVQILEAGFEGFQNSRQVFRVDQREQVLSREIFRLITHHPFQGGAGIEEVAVLGNNGEDVQRVFCQGAEVSFAPDQFRFNPPAFRALLRLLCRSEDGRNDALRPELEDIIGHAGFETVDGYLFAYGSREDNKGNVGQSFTHHAQGLDANEPRNQVVRQDQIELIL